MSRSGKTKSTGIGPDYAMVMGPSCSTEDGHHSFMQPNSASILTDYILLPDDSLRKTLCLLLPRETRLARIVSLHQVRRDPLVVDDESIADSESFELGLRQWNQRPHLAAINGCPTDDFGDQLAA